MSKVWAAGIVIGCALYFIFLIFFTTYGAAFATEFGLTNNGNATTDVNVTTALQQQTSCDYPRYRYDLNGQQDRFVFNLDNLDCSISAGALGESSCNAINGCTWENTTSGFLFWTEQTQICSGEINKTFYNDGVETSDNICVIDGLQNTAAAPTCAKLGCTVYEPVDTLADGRVGFLTIFQQVSDLFTFRYTFGFEGLLALLATFCLIYLPTILLLVGLYILSPFSL